MLSMWKKFARLFVIKTRFEAAAVIYALALGAVTRGSAYLDQYPGFGGWLLFAACTGAVFMAGAKLLEATRAPVDRRRDDRGKVPPRRLLRRGRRVGVSRGGAARPRPAAAPTTG